MGVIFNSDLCFLLLLLGRNVQFKLFSTILDQNSSEAPENNLKIRLFSAPFG